MHPASKGAALVLGILALASFAYAGWLAFRGHSDDAIFLGITGIICAALIALLGGQTPEAKE